MVPCAPAGATARPTTRAVVASIASVSTLIAEPPCWICLSCAGPDFLPALPSPSAATPLTPAAAAEGLGGQCGWRSSRHARPRSHEVCSEAGGACCGHAEGCARAIARPGACRARARSCVCGASFQSVLRERIEQASQSMQAIIVGGLITAARRASAIDDCAAISAWQVFCSLIVATRRFCVSCAEMGQHEQSA
jgi:hypothetical protein